MKKKKQWCQYGLHCYFAKYYIYCYYIQTTASTQRYRAIFQWVSEIRRDLASFPCSALWLIRKACANFSTNKMQNWTASQLGRSRFPALKYLLCLFSDLSSFWLLSKLFSLFWFTVLIALLLFLQRPIKIHSLFSYRRLSHCSLISVLWFFFLKKLH